MTAVILSQDQFTDLINRIEDIKTKITVKTPQDIILDNNEFQKLMKISKRTAQAWRDEGIITFTQVGSKIYYRMSDIEKLIKKSIPVVKSHAYDVTMMHDIPKQSNVGVVSNSLNHRRKPGKRIRAFTQRA